LTEAAQANPVVSIAMQYVGVPYQWGGESPKTGFDCSGLVRYVFAKVGVLLPHYAAAQWYSPDAVWVAPNRLEPGDLVFFTGSDGTRKAPGHVGIYVGDGYLIDAPHTGTDVRIDSLDEPKLADEYVGARQIAAKLLVARHLRRAIKTGGSATASPFGLPSPIMTAPLEESLAVPTTGTAAVRTTSRGHWIWAGAALVGLLPLLLTGGLLARRRGSPTPPRVPEP
jgi:hypothetical protein